MRLSGKLQETMRLNPRCAKRSIANWPRPQRLTAKIVWTPHAGETLFLRAEHGNTVDRFAVAVLTGSNIVGYVVMDYSRVFWYFIQKRHSSIVCKISGSRCLSEVSAKGSETRSEANLCLRKATRVATTLVTTGSSLSHHSHKRFPLTIIIFLFLGSDN